MDFGDPRLNRRAVLLAERLGQKPGASIPGACENWAETAAAYRFLRNEQVSSQEALDAHGKATLTLPLHRVVLNLRITRLFSRCLVPALLILYRTEVPQCRMHNTGLVQRSSFDPVYN